MNLIEELRNHKLVKKMEQTEYGILIFFGKNVIICENSSNEELAKALELLDNDKLTNLERIKDYNKFNMIKKEQNHQELLKFKLERHLNYLALNGLECQEAIIPKKIDGQWKCVLTEQGEEDVVLEDAPCELSANYKCKYLCEEAKIPVPQSVTDYIDKDKEMTENYFKSIPYEPYFSKAVRQ